MNAPQLTYHVPDVAPSRLANYHFAQACLTNRYRFISDAAWSTLGTTPLSALAPRAHVVSQDSDGDQTVFLTTDGGVAVLVSREFGQVRLTLAGDDDAAIEHEIGRWKQLLPAAEKPDAVTVTFWYSGPHGPSRLRRLIAAPTWADIQGNYAGTIRNSLTAQMAFKPSAAGQLILWHGNPGTGKTYALRALARSWQSWCDVHYITDPDNFFGRNVAYLMNTVFSGQGDDDDDDLPPRHGTASDPARKRWRLVVLEDAGELLLPDAREQVGQALSRLLNLVDGLLGQGLRVLVLITTNEPLGKLHPAVARPGRCAAKTEFIQLPVREAQDWLKQHGKEPVPSAARARTIAELYAEIGGGVAVDAAVPVGFQPVGESA